MASHSLLEVSLSLLECASAKLVFTIQSSEVFALSGDLLYIFCGSSSRAFCKFAGERLFAH